MKSRGAAYDWEFRWRFPILIASQPVLAVLAHRVSNAEGIWYAPEFPALAGWLAVFVATLGILLRVQATTTLRARVMASDDPDTSRFVTRGIYRAVRNPLYVSSLLLFGAYALFFGWGWAVGFVAFHGWRYRRIVRLEEHSLRCHWGVDFDDFCRNVPRWLPRWSEFRREFGRRLSLHGVIGNSVYVGIWLGIVVSAARNNLTWIIPFECAGGLAMAVYYANRSAKTITVLPRESTLPVSKTNAPPNSQPLDFEAAPGPYFESEGVAERPSVPTVLDKSAL